MVTASPVVAAHPEMARHRGRRGRRAAAGRQCSGSTPIPVAVSSPTGSAASPPRRASTSRWGRIDGSLYGAMRLSDVRVSDPKGVFLTSPRLDVDWRPFAYVNNHVDVKSVGSDLITLRRNPELRPYDRAGRPQRAVAARSRHRHRPPARRPFRDGAPGGGRPPYRGVDGAAHIADRRAQLTVNAAACARPVSRGATGSRCG
ncbi:hypothetical protein AB5I41_30175 [Sphingomonas sp. MMS24-JH45]